MAGMILREFRPLSKNSLRGFATVELPSGLIVKDISLHTSNGKSWASLPAKPHIAKDGSPVMKDGKAQYLSILQWKDRALADRFSDALVGLVSTEHPGALN
jgi:hypothetical protein